jgi:hypothetical protein
MLATIGVSSYFSFFLRERKSLNKFVIIWSHAVKKMKDFILLLYACIRSLILW